MIAMIWEASAALCKPNRPGFLVAFYTDDLIFVGHHRETFAGVAQAADFCVRSGYERMRRMRPPEGWRAQFRKHDETKGR